MFKICNFLMRKGVPTPRATAGAANAGTRWQQNTIKSILNNPVYVGKLVFRREETTGTLAESELYKVRRKIETDQQIVTDDAHPALIAEEDFIAVQELMKKRGKHKSNGKESLFSYIVKCSDCGSGMHFKPDRRNGAYICGGYVKHTSAFCSSHIIEQQKLLKAVREDLQAIAKDTVKAETLFGVVEGKVAESQVAVTKELKRLEKQINETNARFDSLLTLHVDKVITTEQFKQQNERITQQHQDLAIKKAELILVLESKQNCDQQLHAFKKEVGRFITLDFDDEQVMKQVLQRLIHKIEVFEGERIKIHYNLSNPYATN